MLVRFRYRAYMGGPDPLAEPDPPPEEAVVIARELLGFLPEEEAGDLRRALVRYAEGDRSALEGIGAGGGVGGRRRELLDRLDEADHGLSPRELRRLGEVALREARGRGGGEPSGRVLPRGGDRALDAVATVREAMLRRARAGEEGVALRAEDLRFTETEPEDGRSVSLLVDLSHSMADRRLHEAAVRTALALEALLRRHPQDRVQLVGFGDTARKMTSAELVAHPWHRVPGTNLHHALRLAREHGRRHPGLPHQVFVVTDGEPTAHLGEDGDVRFSWPASPRTADLTLAELDSVLRDGAEVCLFLLSDDPRLRAFRDLASRRRGVRTVDADADALAPLLLSRYLDGRPW